MKIDAVLFDLDETLHARTRSLAAFARRIYAGALPGVAAGTSEEDFVGTVLRGDERGNRPPEGLLTWLANRYDLGLTVAELVEVYLAWEHPVLFDDTEETLRRLRPRKLGIVTNGSERSQAAKIANSGLDRKDRRGGHLRGAGHAQAGARHLRGHLPPPRGGARELRHGRRRPGTRCRGRARRRHAYDLGRTRPMALRPGTRDYDASVTRLSEVVHIVERWDRRVTAAS